MCMYNALQTSGERKTLVNDSLQKFGKDKFNEFTIKTLINLPYNHFS